MAKKTLTEHNDAFNQVDSPVSPRDLAFQSAENIEKLEFMALLLAKADALSTVALRDTLSESSNSERHHYLAALNELVVASREQLEDLLERATKK